MGRFFSDKVETAIPYIYYDLGAQRGQEGFRLLQEACREGDADAYCLLARCLYGQEYTWLGHDFPVDEDAADELIYQSVMMGSALGTLIAMRCGVMNKELQEAMPLASLKAAYDIILEKAEAGNAFCQMVIGNVYYWYDFLQIENINPEDFDSDDAFESFIHENMLKCEYWYKSALDGGVATAGANLILMYIDGIEGVLPPQPEKAKELDRIYAAKGYPNYQYFYACDLFDEDKHEEAYPLFCKAAEAGEPRAYFFVGNYYENGVAAPHDDAKAAEYYQKAIDSNIPVKAGCYNRLGAMYFDGRGVEQDYDKAFRLLKWADDSGKTGNWGAYYLGYCYTYGEGTERDYVLARKYLEAVDWDCQDAFFLLGWLYCNGEGGPEDIAKGVSYLQKAKDLPEAQEELSHYKKNFFGKWVRRDKTETVLRGLLRLQSMFGSDKKEAPQLPQPSTTFDWILTIRSRLNSEDTPTPAYGQVEKALRSLTTEPEQLIILWQQNPNNADAYWFIRCSVYARSKDNDIYLIEVAFPHNGGTEFWQKTVKYLTDALPYFDAAYHHKIIDFTGFEKQEE